MILVVAIAVPDGSVTWAREAQSTAPLVLAPEGGYDFSETVEPSAAPTGAQADPRLVFAPEIDTDGDPGSNPAEGLPAPVEDVLGRLTGRISVAVHVPPGAPARSGIGVPVTIRVWDGQGVEQRRTAHADAWGAVFVTFVIRDLTGEYAYQASAPGYAHTEVRRFRFDPARHSLIARMDGARLTTHRRADGTLTVNVHSPYALEGQSEVSLIVGRKPAQRPDLLDRVAPNALEAVPDYEPYLSFPSLAMRAVESHMATVDLTLPPGEYSLLGSLLLPGRTGAGDQPSRILFSQKARLTVPDVAVPTSAAPVGLDWDAGPARPARPTRPAVSVSALPFEPGKHLVRYASTMGEADFGLVDEDAIGDVALVEPTGPPAVERRRVGAFEWEEIRREVRTTVLVDDGKKRAWIQDARFDPLLRRYTVAVQSLQQEPVTDWLRVDVLGPGGVVLKHEDVQVTLQPDKPLEHLVEVPAALGRPTGLRVTLDDPLVQEMTITERRVSRVELAQSEPSGDSTFETVNDDLLVGMVLISRNLFVSFHYKVMAQVLGFVLAQFDYPSKVAWEWLPQSDIAIIIYDVIDYLGFSAFENPGEAADYRFKAGSASVDSRVSGGAFANVSPVCSTAVEESKAMLDSIKRIAIELVNWANSNTALQKLSKPWQTPVFKLVPFLFGFFWAGVWGTLTISVAPDVNFDDASFTMQFMLKAGITAELSAGVIGPGLPQFDDFTKFQDIVMVGAALVQASRFVQNLMASIRKVKTKGCNAQRDPPEPRPADDRQDLWDDVTDLVGVAGANDSLDRLRELRDRARTLNLTLAERFLAPEIAAIELDAFAGNGSAAFDHWAAVASIHANHAVTMAGLLSGTLPLSPTGSLTLSLQAANDALNAELGALPFARQRRSLIDARFTAERDAASLYGYELELQHELRLLLSAGVVGVLSVGFPGATIFALKNAGLPYQLVSLFPQGDRVGDVIAPYMRPDEAPRALVVPSAGMYPIMQSAETRVWLDAYVRGGGLLVVFTQAFDEDWAALPGGQVRGVGYEQDQRCEHETVRAAMPSNWLNWMGKPMPDVQVDGAFTHWPADANVLLVRTSGTYVGYPAMIEYSHGEGRVLATTAYGDWAVSTAIWWGDDWAMTRSILIRAWLLANGMDVDDAQAVGPSTDFVAEVPVTNTGSLTVTGVEAGFRVLPGVWIYATSSDYTTTFGRPVSLTAGQSVVVTGSLRTPPLLRATDHSHSWSRAGLYRYYTRLTAPGAAPINGWDGFIRITSPVTVGNISLVLSADAAAVPPGRPLVVTATVRNFDAVAQTVLVRGELNLPATTVTVTVPAGGSVQLGYGVVMTGSRNVRLAVFDLSNQRLTQASLALYVASPRVRASLTPPALEIGSAFTVTVRNRSIEGQPASLSPVSTLRVTVTQPSGGVLVTGARTIPELRPGDTRPEVFMLPDGLTGTGVYTVQARIVYSGSVEDAGDVVPWPCYGVGICAPAQTSPPLHVWELSTRVAIRGHFAAAGHAVRNTGAFVARVSSSGVSGMGSPVTISVPAFGLSWAGVVTATDIGGTFGVSFTVPETATAASYPLLVEAGQGEVQSKAFSLIVAPSRMAFQPLSLDALSAGGVLTFALRNLGGVDTIADYRAELRDRSGVRVVLVTATVPVSSQVAATVTIGLPSMLADGSYWLTVSGRDVGTLQPFVGGMSMTITGVKAALAAWSDAATYVSGAPITAAASVTAVQGAVTGVVRFRITSDQAMSLTWDVPDVVNDNTEGGLDEASFVYHDQPAVASDADSNTHAVWVDRRERTPSTNAFSAFNSFYYAWRSPVSTTWSANERVGAFGADCRSGTEPGIGVDGLGVVHVLAVCNGNYGISYTQRLTTGVWTSWETVVGADGFFHDRPSLAVDEAGNAFATWTNYSPSHLHFAIRPAGGSWSGSVSVSSGSSANSGGSIATSPTGTVFLAYRATYTGVAGLYFRVRETSGDWSQPEAVVTASLGSYESVPRIALDGSGRAHVAYASSNRVYYVRRDITGTWSAPEIALSQYLAGILRNQAIGVSGSGTPVIAGISYYVNGVGQVYSYLRTGQRSISGTWPVNSPVTSSPESLVPAVAVAPDDSVTLLWRTTRDRGDEIASYDVGKISSSSRPLSGFWGPVQVVNDDRGGAAQDQPTIALDAAGNAYVAWLDNRDYFNAARFARRDAISGTWSTEEKISTLQTTNGYSMPESIHIGVNGVGQALAVWRGRWGLGAWRIWGVARSITGTWGANEAGPTGAPSYTLPRAAVDADGSSDVAYTRTGPDINVVRRSITGTWGVAERINDLAGGQHPALAMDSQGARHVAWQVGGAAGSLWSSHAASAGAWLPDERMDVGPAKNSPNRPWLATDGAGTLYGLWRYNDNTLHFAKRPAGAAWQPAEAITVGGTMTRDVVGLAVDPVGNALAAWVEYSAGGPLRVHVRARSASGVWLPAQMLAEGSADVPWLASVTNGQAHIVWRQINPAGPGLQNFDIYHTILYLDGADPVVWTADLPIDTNASQAISAAVGTLGGLPGKYTLRAEVLNALSQTLAVSSSVFYLHPAEALITLGTDREAYLPGDGVEVSGRLTNPGATTASYTLTVLSDQTALLTQVHTLGAGEGVSFTTRFTPTTNVLLSAQAAVSPGTLLAKAPAAPRGRMRANASTTAVAFDLVRVASPVVQAAIGVPDGVAAPFTATLTLSNTGGAPVTITARLGLNPPVALRLDPGEVAGVAGEMAGASRALGYVQAVIAGDVAFTATEGVTWGEEAVLRVTAPVSPVAGSLSMAWVVTGTGALPFEAALAWSVDGDPVTQTALSVAPNIAADGQVVLDLAAGAHVVAAALVDAYANVVVTTTAVFTVAPSRSPEANVRIAGLRTVTATSSVIVTVTNDGGQAEPTVLGAQLYDLPVQLVITPAAASTLAYTLSLPAPADMPGGVYVGEVTLEEQRAPFTMTRRASAITMTLATNKPTYAPNETVTLSVRLTESANVAATYNLWLRYGELDRFITTTVVGNGRITVTFVFSALASTERVGVGLAYTPTAGATAARTIVFDSALVRVADGSRGAWLQFSKAAPYNAGETVFYTATITGTFNTVVVFPPTAAMAAYSNTIMWTAPTTGGLAITGTYPLTFVIPADVPSKRYSFVLNADSGSDDYPVDVRGTAVLVRRASVTDAPRAKTGLITGVVEFVNQGGLVGGLRLWAFLERPDSGETIELSPVVSRLITLTPGLNLIVVTGTYTTPVVGMHRLRVDLRKPGAFNRASAAMMQFDVGDARMVDLSTDHGTYGVGDPGVGRVDVFGHGSAQVVVTATTGATVFSATADLNGFATFSYAIPTGVAGDYALVGRLTDASGNVDERLRAYAVVDPIDTVPPTLTVGVPATTTILVSNAPAVTFVVQGTAGDDRGAVSVSVNGEVTTTGGGAYAVPIALRQGFNSVAVSAVDPSGNYTSAAAVTVYVQPTRAVTLTASAAQVRPGERVTFTLALTAGADVDESTAAILLPTTLITDVAVEASTGAVGLSGIGALTVTAVWAGSVLSTTPTTMRIGASAILTGTLPGLARVVWGFGPRAEAAAHVIVSGQFRRFVPSTMRDGLGQW